MTTQDYESRVLSMMRESLSKPKGERAPITSTGPTPYDTEEQEFQEWLLDHPEYEEGKGEKKNSYKEFRRAWRLGGADGYRRAKAEDRALLEAALAHITQLHQTDQALFACETADRIREALTPSTSTT